MGYFNAKTNEYNNEKNIRGNELDKIIEEIQLFILNQNREPTNYPLTKDRNSKIGGRLRYLYRNAY